MLLGRRGGRGAGATPGDWLLLLLRLLLLLLPLLLLLLLPPLLPPLLLPLRFVLLGRSAVLCPRGDHAGRRAECRCWLGRRVRLAARPHLAEFHARFGAVVGGGLVCGAAPGVSGPLVMR